MLLVKYYDGTDVGAPTVTGDAGTGIALLDAVLVNGYNTKSILSITRSGSEATVLFAMAHGYRSAIPQVVAISGFYQAEYNGEFLPHTITSTSFKIDIVGTPATSGTGSAPTCKVAPLGWSKSYSGTNIAIYHSNYTDFNCSYLRIDDTNSQYMSARGYETLSAAIADNGVGLFPTVDQQARSRMYKSAGSSSARPWRVIGDNAFVYFLTAGSLILSSPWSYAADIGYSYAFGNILSRKSGDAYATVIHTSASSTPASSSLEAGTGVFGYIARSYTQQGSSQIVHRNSSCGNSGGGGGSYSSTYPSYPCPLDGSLMLAGPWYCMQQGEYRGVYPGAYPLPQQMYLGLLPDKTIVSDLAEYPGKTFLISYTKGGMMAFDLYGPWR